MQNIDGLMMARQFDTSKHNECYRPIPVHTPNIRPGRPGAKPYTNLNTSDAANTPRYDSEYDYKTTHYPSYPPNYPYDDNNKYKYDGQGYNNAYEKPAAGYPSYEDPGYDARNYMAQHTTAPPPNPAAAYPSDPEYARYNYEGRPAVYPVMENPDYTEKARYNYGYDRNYYEADGRYASPDCRYALDVRYPDTRHADNRIPADSREAGECRYPVDNRDMERRYAVDGNRDPDGRYTVENREVDTRYPADGKEVDARFADTSRYPAKENYYDRYYKHRPSRDHHVSDTSRY